MKKIILMLCLNVLLLAVPAHQEEKEFKQSDNSSFRGQLKGDEWFSWVETKDGYIAKYNTQSKNYEYITLNDEGDIVYSKVKVQKALKVPKKIKKVSSAKLSKAWKSAWKNAHKRPTD